ncbi:phenylacetyl-CoA ligase [Athelia psychrophila]|uniref:Phenylacetyl-CoA ligase n=1 Tax=Athelia psychrophila TaxID=1759441 RepID=A0A165ZZH0_9AGAM|nr:phenylacetyl-CoA ligase [Fibularhizoctonia sp. CBS 109695]
MTEFTSLFGPLDPIPDDVSVAQFILDQDHPRRPVRPTDTAWLIDYVTGRKVFYEELRERTHGLANALHHKYAFGNDDIACIFSPNDVDYPVAVWAAHRLGGAVSTANPSYTIDELVHQLTIVKPAILLTDPAVLSTALEAARKVGLPADRVILFKRIPDSPSSMVSLDELISHGLSSTALPFVEPRMAPGEAKSKVAFYCFSSGTTGPPKAVAIAHYALVANVIQQAVMARVGDSTIAKDEQRYRPGDIASGILPLFHIYGLVCNLHAMLFNGMSVVLIPKFNFEGFLKSILRFRMTHLLLVPPMIVLLCKHSAVQNHDLSLVRDVLSGGAPLSPEIVPLLAALLPRATISQGYGMTETATVVSIMRLGERHTRGGSGALLPGVRARVVKADGSLAQAGETGELVVTGPSMALGYANNAQATGETFVDGWVRTGDEVRVDAQGELWIVDRLKELIKVRGFQVAPSELEGHLLDHPAVADACVVPVPDEYSGELPLAFVVPHPAFADRMRVDPQEAARVRAALLAHVAEAKTRYKWLAGGVEFVDAIPKTPSGKLLRRVLRERARVISHARAAGAAQPHPSRPLHVGEHEQVVLGGGAVHRGLERDQLLSVPVTVSS